MTFMLMVRFSVSCSLKNQVALACHAAPNVIIVVGISETGSLIVEGCRPMVYGIYPKKTHSLI